MKILEIDHRMKAEVPASTGEVSSRRAQIKDVAEKREFAFDLESSNIMHGVLDELGKDSSPENIIHLIETLLEVGSFNMTSAQALVESCLLTLKTRQKVQSMAWENEKLSSQNEELTEQASKMTSEFKALKATSVTDSLTGLKNRRAFDNAINRRFQESLRMPERIFSIIIIDVDKFKSVNDTHGHAFGDQVLCKLSKILERHTRGTDLVARYGGEEFAVLLPDQGISGAKVAAEKLRSAIEKNAVFESDGGEAVKVTASLGVSEYHENFKDASKNNSELKEFEYKKAMSIRKTEDREPLELFYLKELADKALYHCKHEGRNCVSEFNVTEQAPKKFNPHRVGNNTGRLMAVND